MTTPQIPVARSGPVARFRARRRHRRLPALPAGVPVLSPTDLANSSLCEHRAAQDRLVKLGLLAAPDVTPDPMALRLAAQGIRHEAAVAAALADSGVSIAEIPSGDWPAAAEMTRRAMTAGVQVIYQAALVSADGRRHGYADFLLRVDEPSRLGGWGYEPADAKLATTPHDEHWLQVADYAAMLDDVQGRPPARVHILAGDGTCHTRTWDEVTGAWRSASARLAALASGGPPAPPEPCAACGMCRWSEDCGGRWVAAEHLSVVKVTAPTRRKLAAAGVTTVSQLADADPAELAKECGSGRSTLDKAASRARLWRAAESIGQPLVAVTDPELLAALTDPSTADRFIDFEADNSGPGHANAAELFYLFGDCDGDGTYRAVWAHDPHEEHQALLATLDLIEQTTAAGGRVIHYGPYERTSLRTLAARHGEPVERVDAALESELVVDLLAVARRAIITSGGGYGLKALEVLYAPDLRAGHTALDAAAAADGHERFVATGDLGCLEPVRAYNAADVISTVEMVRWLRSLADVAAGEYVVCGPSTCHAIPTKSSR